jgi:hypothetical protein
MTVPITFKLLRTRQMDTAQQLAGPDSGPEDGRPAPAPGENDRGSPAFGAEDHFSTAELIARAQIACSAGLELQAQSTELRALTRSVMEAARAQRSTRDAERSCPR